MPAPATAGGRAPGASVAAPPLALRLGRAAARIGDARFLDRLVRGRAWIAIVAVGLLGIVFMQVSMLRLNAGISRAVTSAETLHRQNAALRADISRLDSGDRIHDAAGAMGLILPPAGQVRYLDARKGDARRAARGIRRPDPVAAAAGGGAASAQQAPAQQAATALSAGAAGAAATTAAATTATATTAATMTATTPAATTQAAPATQTAGATTQEAPATQAAPATTQAAPATTQAAPATTQTTPAGTTQAAPATAQVAPATAQTTPAGTTQAAATPPATTPGAP